MNLVCDVNDVKAYPCHITLFIQIPTFDRTIVSQRMSMSWTVSLTLIILMRK